MIVPIDKKLTFINKKPIEVYKDLSLEKRIQENWNAFLQENDGYFNGDIYVVTDLNETHEEYILEIGKAKYADLIYAKKNIDLSILSLFVSIALKTKDNYCVLIKNNHDMINTIGGFASNEDFINEIFSPEICLEREVKEEIGLNINNKNDIIEYHRKYLKIPAKKENMYPCGIVFTGLLNYTKTELEEYFNKQKENFDNEIKELLFYTKDNYLDLNKIENKASYLVELIETIENIDA